MAPKSGDSNADIKPQNNDGNASNQEDIWSSILRGVASSKIVPTKNLLILGDRDSGKSSLIRHLKGEVDEDTYEANGSVSKGVGTSDEISTTKRIHNDLALSYTFVEVKDDEAEDTLARLGLYQLAGSQEAYQSLLRFALNTTTLPDSLVVIVLDWARPWTFIETLQRWIKFVEVAIENVKKEGAIGSKDGWTKGKAVVDELKEQLQRFIKNYESDATTANGSVPTSSVAAEEVELSLRDGTLTTNLAVPLVVVCTKSDNVIDLKRNMEYKEEQLDYIQQSLRTICLKYGAALFYTTTRQPMTFANLRRYILHRLLGSKSSSSDTKSVYSFNIKANFAEHDVVLVPAGWDSWEKIKILRDGFDCDGLLQGWDLDMSGEKELSDVEESNSARKVYEVGIAHVDNDKPFTDPSIIVAEDEQEFFQRHFDTLQKANNERPPSVVGPMGMPQYPYAANLGADIPDLDNAPMPIISSRPSKTKPVSTTQSPPPGLVTNGTGPVVTAATAGSSTSSQNDVLANFFQALLTKKANSTTTTSQGAQQTSSNESSSNSALSSKSSAINTNGTTAPSRQMVEKELDRLRNLPNSTASTAGKIISTSATPFTAQP